jgi:hypothetical protein
MPNQPWIPAGLKVSNPPRGSGTQAPKNFVAQSMRATFAWGSNPGSATIVYVGDGTPVTTGALVEITIGAHYFAGICKSDVYNAGSRSGKVSTLQFVDLRELLSWDYVFCLFNRGDVRLVNGIRKKRYVHIYPADYDRWIKTYTDTPLNAWEILGAILSYTSNIGGTIGTAWTYDLTGGGLFPQGVLTFPLYEFDCLGGKRLDAALNEICEVAGAVFTLMSTPTVPYKLVFTRKGYGAVPTFPENTTGPFAPNSDDRRIGTSLSGHATNVRILGERNQYQVMDLPMVPDWARGWEAFLSFDQFADDIFQRDTDPRSGKRFNAIPGDNEQFQGRQLAMARALEITVRDYVSLRGGASGGGATFVDTRKFSGRFRMDMPAALYLQTLVFRAFRPDPAFVFVNNRGKNVPMDSVDIIDRLLCKVTHNPTTGVMNFETQEPCDGNGYAIVKGYQIGADLFKSLRSDQFTLDFFTNAKSIWQHVPFQIDDSGEGVRFIIFDEPVIVSENLIIDKDGHKSINAGFTLSIPQVKAALVLEAERYTYWLGTYPNVSRDAVQNVGGLNYEMVAQYGFYSEISYSNGQTADQKADALATAFLNRQYIYAEGGQKLVWDKSVAPAQFGTPLTNGNHSCIDRVEIVTSPQQGTYEVVDFTNERQRDYFEPEREFDRKTMSNSLFPGQAELRIQAEYARKLAAGFKQFPKAGELLRKLLTGGLGSDHPLDMVWFNNPTAALLPLGTPIRKSPSNTNPTYPSSDSVFVGVTVRNNEDTTKPLRVQTTGVRPVRVQGPVAVNDTVGLSPGANDFLVKDGSPAVGKALQPIGDTSVKTIMVQLAVGGGQSTKDQAYVVKSHRGNYLICHKWTGVGELSTDVPIAKPQELWYTVASVVVDGVTITYSGYDINSQTRQATIGSVPEIQVIVPRYVPGQIIYATQPDLVQVNTDPNFPFTQSVPCTLQDMNKGGRAWARKFIPGTQEN